MVAIVNLKPRNEAADKAISLLRKVGIENGLFDESVQLSSSKGRGYETLWHLNWLEGDNSAKTTIGGKDHRKELRLMGYIDKNDILTKRGSRMYNRLRTWYATDECD